MLTPIYTYDGLNTIELKIQFKSKIDQLIQKQESFSVKHVVNWVNEELLKDKVKARGKEFSISSVRLWMIKGDP